MPLLNRLIGASLPLLPKPLVRRFAGPYIAGETVADLIAETERLNRRGFRVAVSQLGEFVEERAEAEAATSVYLEVLDEIHGRDLDAYIHVKLTQLGLLIDPGFCRDQVARILERAARRGRTFVRMDMEDSPQISATLALYDELRASSAEFGVVIQARMRRSLADVRSLLRGQGAVRLNARLCKGVYLEPHDIAWTDPAIIRDSFLQLLRELLEGGARVAIATHDEWLIFHAIRILDERGKTPEDYEFQMLHGVRPDLRQIVRDAGHPVRVGVPFGPDWLPYSLRRLRKNPEMLRHVTRAVFTRMAARRPEGR